MRRPPVLVRLTAAFATATLLMLAAAAGFVYLRLRADLDDRVDANLRARSEAAAAALTRGVDIEDVAVEDPEESFARVLSGDRVVSTAGSVIGSALTRDEVRRSLDAAMVVERRLPGVDGKARILAVAYPSASGSTVIAIGQSLVDRDEALSNVLTSFLVGGLAALVAASAAGYALARSGLAPVEAMRARASQISAKDDDTELPLPEARDQIRRLGETLNDMLRRLRASYVRERRFVDDASHELRTPLAVIQTDLEGALIVGGHSTPVYEALTSALDETHRLAKIVEDLLVLARAAEGQMPIHLERVSLPELMSWIQSRFVGVAHQRGRRLTSSAPQGLEVDADRDRLRQMMTNLVDNAFRHGAGDISVMATSERDGLTIAVRDDGAGFPASFAPRAFERLARADSSRRVDGAGIGLSIVRAIAEAHGGTSTVEVGPPGTISVWLPVRSQRP